MRKSILFLVALALVASGAFAADIGGKVEFKSELTLDEDIKVGSSPTFEANITAAVDSYNSATIELREQLGEKFTVNSDDTSDSATYTLDKALPTIGSVFFESDIGGALGLTEATGGLNIKYKGGWFSPETTEVGELKDLVEQSDVANAAVSGPDLGSTFTLGFADFINLDVGLKIAQLTDIIISAYGSVVAGPGTLGYQVYFAETDAAKVIGEAESGKIGGGIQYADIALGGDVSLGVGVEGYYDLSKEEDNLGVGLNVVADISNWLDIDLAGNYDASEVDLGLGIQAQDPSESLGLVLKVNLEDLVGKTDDDTLKFGLNPELWMKAGAAKFTVGWTASDLGDMDNNPSQVYLTSLLEF